MEITLKNDTPTFITYIYPLLAGRDDHELCSPRGMIYYAALGAFCFAFGEALGDFFFGLGLLTF